MAQKNMSGDALGDDYISIVPYDAPVERKVPGKTKKQLKKEYKQSVLKSRLRDSKLSEQDLELIRVQRKLERQEKNSKKFDKAVGDQALDISYRAAKEQASFINRRLAKFFPQLSEVELADKAIDRNLILIGREE